ncbi:HupE/UreJ family protein [Rhizobacter fulvus]
MTPPGATRKLQPACTTAISPSDFGVASINTPLLASAAGGLWDGLLHPILGFDHLLAMVCVGVVSALLVRTAVWAMPASFVLAMALGGMAGLQGAVLPQGEKLIAASLLALGLVVSVGPLLPRHRRLMFWTATAFAAVFGAAHGNAHGLEIPGTADPAAFTAGFLLGTTALHLIGVGMGLWADREQRLMALRLGGLFTAALGLGLLTK